MKNSVKLVLVEKIIFQKNSYMREELDRVILNLIQFGILDKMFKEYDYISDKEGRNKIGLPFN